MEFTCWQRQPVYSHGAGIHERKRGECQSSGLARETSRGNGKLGLVAPVGAVLLWFSVSGASHVASICEGPDGARE